MCPQPGSQLGSHRWTLLLLSHLLVNGRLHKRLPRQLARQTDSQAKAGGIKYSRFDRASRTRAAAFMARHRFPAPNLFAQRFLASGLHASAPPLHFI